MEDIRPDSRHTLRLLNQVQTGDREALGQLLKRHRPKLERAVARRLDRRVRSRLDGSDIVQETQLEASQRIDDFLAERPMPFHLWIMRAAHQRLLKAERRHLQTAKRSIDREIPLPDNTSLHLVATIAGSATGHEVGTVTPSDAISGLFSVCIGGINRDGVAKRLPRVWIQSPSSGGSAD